MTTAARAAILAAALSMPFASRASIGEAWYLARARANMEIRNYSAAIEAYEKALQADPSSREAARGLALAYERNGDTDRAVAARDRYLARAPDDADAAFAQARVLQWSRYAYRRKDAIRYLGMGLAIRDDPARRRDLARLLARDRATLPDAVAEYRRLLAAAPDDAALRDEYLKLLLWDDRLRPEAIAELERRLAAAPGDDRTARALAPLLARTPGREAEAADRYGALAVRHPRDADLAVAHARALVRAGRRAEARAEWARAVALRPTPDARAEYADLLAASGDRDAARAEYEAALRDDPGSRRARLGYARLLAARKDTSRAAIPEFRAVLARSPRDADAQAGLARAYAWNGDADRALAHAEDARRDGGRSGGLAAMERALRTGREPELGGGARLLAQPGGAWAFSGAGGFARGAAEPTPFTRATVEAGWAAFSGGGLRASGAAVEVGAEWRPDPALRWDATGRWDGFRLATPWSGALRLEAGPPGAGEAIGVARRPVRDSLRALAGERTAAGLAGAAAENAIEASVARGVAGFRLEAAARAGAVTAASAAANGFAGLRVRVARPLGDGPDAPLSAALDVEAFGYGRDASGLGAAPDPLAARYFSPPAFASASPRLVLALDGGARGRLDVDAGPAVQLEGGARRGVRAGGDVRASGWRRFGWLRLGAELRAVRIAGAYARAEAMGTAALVF